MASKFLLFVAVACVGASAAPLVSTAPFNNIAGPTVSETVVTPFHRTDAVSTPCGRSVVRSTALPVVPYGLSGAGFLGAGAGMYSGAIAGGLAGGLAGVAGGVYPGVLGGGLVGSGVGAFPGVIAGGCGGAVYPGIVAGGLAGTVGGVYSGNIGGGIIGSGLGVATAGVV